jgi:hypothetical protein
MHLAGFADDTFKEQLLSTVGVDFVGSIICPLKMGFMLLNPTLFCAPTMHYLPSTLAGGVDTIYFLTFRDSVR